MIKFECPACSQSIEAPDEALDVQVDCPTCGHKFWPGHLIPSAIARVPEADPIIEPAPDWIRTQYFQAIHEWGDKLRQGKTNEATARYEVGKVLKSLGYTPERWFPESANIPPAIEEAMSYLSVETCIQMVLNTQREMTNGFARLKAGSTDIALFQFPCWELVRLYTVEIPRGERQGPKGTIVEVPGDDWPSRWETAGGKLVNGRMVAHKWDQVWTKLGSTKLFGDGFDNPFPPFAFNSGMGWRAVGRDEAIELGVIAEDDDAPDAPEDAKKELPDFITIDGVKYDRDILDGLEKELEALKRTL